MWNDPSRIDLSLDSRAITFENPTGARGAGGTAVGGRKGAPSRVIAPGERVVLAEIDGPGTIRHIWMTFPPSPPEHMRSLWMEVYYDGASEPSVSVPCLDFFGLPLGRPAPYSSLLASAQEGRGFNAYFPMPFARHIRVEVTNGGSRPTTLYYQLDYTLEREHAADAGYLHISFRRENPTTMLRDFVIADGFVGPGRFLGCAVGIRVLDDGAWYGEGEMKVYRDGDNSLPTICGTGLEDYVGSAWGMGAHNGLYAGVPIDVRPTEGHPLFNQPDFVSFYRWHVPDPIVFERELKVTIQQIGFALFREGQEEVFDAYKAAHPSAGPGWSPRPGVLGAGIAERVDDYSAAAFVYTREPQAVPRLDVAAAVADIERKEYERPGPFERMLG
ncbi:hypothetical protein AYO38_01110 [bacterium SCGC AG-212-C10]|nr:hypothetical protein AYO38_01110 [bacterium SCGC AG-212-C10]